MFCVRVKTQEEVVLVPELVTMKLEPLFDIVKVLLSVSASLPAKEELPPVTVIAAA